MRVHLLPPGLDGRNIMTYERFIRANNFHGAALANCDLDELKKELKTTFGDWCLIRSFILQVRETKSPAKVGEKGGRVSQQLK